MADEKILGYVDCSYCGEEVALKETKKQKPCITCTNCGNQVFFRAQKSIDIIKSKARPEKRVEADKKEATQHGEERPAKKSNGWDW